jgi:tetratricopeptide (TPR) repeat protein
MTTEPAESQLPPHIAAEIDAASERGNVLAEAGDFDAAIAEYRAALALVPEPRENWEASTWLLTAIGDVHFLAGRLDEAREAFREVMHCGGAIGTPFIHLRRGQIFFEAGELEHAASELMCAYMGDGAEIFEGEDPKYLAFLATRAKLG